MSDPADVEANADVQVAHYDEGDAASVLSSRMTDIISEDGGRHAAEPNNLPQTRRPSTQAATADAISRPDTGISSQRGGWSQASASRRGFVARTPSQRTNITGSISGSNIGRPQSATSRTHVPSLTSHAFFRPMSSQRLQAQRGGPRPSVPGQQGAMEDGSSEAGGSVQRNSMQPDLTAMQGPIATSALDQRPPPSRGTEMTEQETMERVTANTSATNDHYPTGSLADSTRPLQRIPPNPAGLNLNLDMSYKNSGLIPTPVKTPHSFRSSFLLPGRGDPVPNSSDRSTRGREKLSSAASSPGLPPKDADQITPKKRLGSNYQYFSGNTIFCLGGRLQNARSRPINIATGFLFITPSVLFFVFSAPWLWHNISPAIPILYAYVFYLCLSSFIHASVSDPGILPRNLHLMPPTDENEDPLSLGPSMNDWVMIKSTQSSTAAMEVPVKYCKTCNIWRPPRGHHCRICDNCIETQDHHCVWLNNCVGRRNYRYFFTFVTTTSVMAFYLFAASLAQVLVYMDRQHISFGESINHFRVPFAMVIYGFVGALYPAALMGYHLFLVARGETTREYLNSHKFLKKDRHRPFAHGNILKNWMAVFFRPRPPTYMGFKQRYEDGDQRFGERRGKHAAPAPNVTGGGKVMEMRDVPSADGQFQGPAALRGNGS